MHRLRKRLAVFAAAILTASTVLAYPGTANVDAAKKKYVTKLTVSKKVSVEEGKKKTIKVTLKTVGGASKKLTIKSSNKKDHKRT